MDAAKAMPIRETVLNYDIKCNVWFVMMTNQHYKLAIPLPNIEIHRTLKHPRLAMLRRIAYLYQTSVFLRVETNSCHSLLLAAGSALQGTALSETSARSIFCPLHVIDALLETNRRLDDKNSSKMSVLSYLLCRRQPPAPASRSQPEAAARCNLPASKRMRP